MIREERVPDLGHLCARVYVLPRRQGGSISNEFRCKDLSEIALEVLREMAEADVAFLILTFAFARCRGTRPTASVSTMSASELICPKQ
jgi:hypothetical protein